jgi:hypothetical protein
VCDWPHFVGGFHQMPAGALPRDAPGQLTLPLASQLSDKPYQLPSCSLRGSAQHRGAGRWFQTRLATSGLQLPKPMHGAGQILLGVVAGRDVAGAFLRRVPDPLTTRRPHCFSAKFHQLPSCSPRGSAQHRGAGRWFQTELATSGLQLPNPMHGAGQILQGALEGWAVVGALLR